MPPVRRIVVTENVIGLADLKKKLDVVGKRLAINICRRGLLAGAGVIRDDARPRIPKRTGRLAKDLIAESRGVFKDGGGKPVEHRAVVLVRGKGKAGKRSARWRAHFTEYGTEPHSVGKGSIKQVWKGSKAKKKQVGGKHPGARAHPYLRPAFDAKKHEAVRVIEQVIRRELEKELVKLAAGGGKPRKAA